MSHAAPPTAGPRRMTPLFFEGRFGWLHGAGAPAPGATGVVLCGALAQEEICTRQGMMTLADRLAAAGVPTLRFDYRGTGDSADAPLSVESMIEDVARAVDALRQAAGIGGVVLCGLRIGAPIAMMAARRIDALAGIALLAPVVSGAAYLRDMAVSVRFSSLGRIDAGADADAPLNTNGFLWDARLREDVRRVELADLPAPAVPLWVATPHASARSRAATDRWRADGADVLEGGFDDYPGFMRDPTIHVMPTKTIGAATTWIAGLPGVDGPAVSGSVVVADRLTGAGFEETPLRLGPGGAVFGMLCRPAAGDPSPIAALMLHEGSSHHIGNGRAHVRMARRLALAGHASLRLDLTGLGDSPCAGNRRRPFSDPDRLGEALAGVDALAALAPGGIVVSGLCSGAEMAFHAALADRRVVAALLVNMPSIGWEPEPGAAPPRRTLRSSWRALRAGGWRRLARGEVKMLDAARGLRRRAGPATVAEARAQMRTLATRHVRTMFLFSDDDPGLGEVRAQLGDVAGFAPASIHVFDRADHHFNGTDIRRRYEDLYVRTLADIAAGGGAATRPAPVAEHAS